MRQIEKNGAIVLMAFVLVVGIIGVSVSARESGFEANAGAGITGNAVNANIHAQEHANFNSGSKLKNFSEIEKEYRDNNESNASLEDSLNEINRFAGPNAAASGFAQVSHGTGWAISNNDTGAFAQITLVQRPFVNVTNATVTGNETNSTNSTVNESAEFTVGNGVLKLTGEPAFNLKFESSSGNTFTFNVSGDNAGTLTLTKETSLTGFTVWSGNLELDNGISWSLHIATMDSRLQGEVNPIGNLTKQEAHIQQKIQTAKTEGFWARLRNFFFRNNANSGN